MNVRNYLLPILSMRHPTHTARQQSTADAPPRCNLPEWRERLHTPFVCATIPAPVQLWGVLMSGRLRVAALLLCSLAPEAEAQSCASLPPGPQRFACASEKNPNLVAKRERCKEEGRRIGLSTTVKGGMGPYVQACMQR